MWACKTMVHCFVFKTISLWARWVQSTLSHLIIIYFKIMLPSVTNYPKWHISSIISGQTFVCIFFFFSPCLSHLMLFHFIALPYSSSYIGSINLVLHKVLVCSWENAVKCCTNLNSILLNLFHLNGAFKLILWSSWQASHGISSMLSTVLTNKSKQV